MSTCAPLLDTCLTDAMADSIGLMLIDTFKVQAFSMAADGSGGITQTWSDLATGIAGFFAPSAFQSIEAQIGTSQQAERRWTVLLEKGTTIEEANRLVQTHKAGTAITARYFKIITVYAEDTMASLVKCECVELPNLV